MFFRVFPQSTAAPTTLPTPDPRPGVGSRAPLHVLPRRRVQDVDLPAGALVQAGALELAAAAIGPGDGRGWAIGHEWW